MKTFKLILAIVGVAIGVVGRGYHCAVHPEWSEMTAWKNLWWVWLIGAVMLLPCVFSKEYGHWFSNRSRPIKRPERKEQEKY